MPSRRRVSLPPLLGRLWIALAVAVSAAAASATGAQSPANQPAPATRPSEQKLQFMRFIDNGDAGGRLETADVTCRNPDGVVLRLVAAVHIGEHAYYQELARSFGPADAVLYEMVKPRGMAPPPPGVPTGSGVGELQRFLKDFLDLDYQLDGIDYTRPNFVHADLDTETFEKLQAQRGESFATLMLQQLLNAMTNPPQSASQEDSVTQLIQVLTRPDAERQMKLMIARQMQDIESVAAGLEGPRGSVILTERNKAAIAVLQRELKAGKRNMVLFYGAAHMGDLSRRVESLGFSPVSTQWHLAWNLTIRPDQPSAIEKLLRELAEPEPQPAPGAAKP